MSADLSDEEFLVLAFVGQLEAFCNEIKARRYVHARKAALEELIIEGQKVLAHGDLLKRLESDELIRQWLEEAIEHREAVVNVVTHFLSLLATIAARGGNR
jgi:hypothetical protein